MTGPLLERMLRRVGELSEQMRSSLQEFSERLVRDIQEGISSSISQLMTGSFDRKAFAEWLNGMGLSGTDLSQLARMLRQQPSWDPYRVLGLDSSAGDDEVKRRYRELVRKIHPDVAGPGTEFLTMLVNVAYRDIGRQRGWTQ